MPPEPPPLRAARIAAGYDTAAGAARVIGMRPNHLTNLETGRKAPTWATMNRVIAGLGLPLEYFFDARQITEAAERLNQRKGARR